MNKYYAISYKLSTIKNGEKSLQEEAPASDPFVFISGFGTTIPGFEKNIENLSKGDAFDFTVPCADAYGEYDQSHVITLEKDIFKVDGVFDPNQIYVDAVIPLQNADGIRFMGRVLNISDTNVMIDLNHPLAGCDLNFIGSVIDCHDATNEEITEMINKMSGGCHGSCGSCGGGCHGEEGGCGSCGDDGCGNCNK